MEAPTERVAQEAEHERLDSTMAEASEAQEGPTPSHDVVTPEALAQLPGDNYSIVESEHDAMISIGLRFPSSWGLTDWGIDRQREQR
jgi:hypothetical protein